jgi:ribosomal protein S18 acetylase RimI-like enzyme
MESVTYKIKTANENEIYTHLIECSDNFYPPLAGRVDIREYSKKIATKAVTLEAWMQNELIGLIAAYINTENKDSFITNVSVIKKYSGAGVASKLLADCIVYAKERDIKKIRLEVNKDNAPAIGFYTKFDFKVSGTKDDELIMKLNLI